MNLSEFTRHEDGRFFRESRLPDTDSNCWVYLLGDNKYLKVIEMSGGWSIFECEDLGFAGENSTQIERELNAQDAQRKAYIYWDES